jgi:hypothetical protein
MQSVAIAAFFVAAVAVGVWLAMQDDEADPFLPHGL